MDYDSVCKYVGQLFLETRHELENTSTKLQKLSRELQTEKDFRVKVEAERDCLSDTIRQHKQGK